MAWLTALRTTLVFVVTVSCAPAMGWLVPASITTPLRLAVLASTGAWVLAYSLGEYCSAVLPCGLQFSRVLATATSKPLWETLMRVSPETRPLST